MVDAARRELEDDRHRHGDQEDAEQCRAASDERPRHPGRGGEEPGEQQRRDDPRRQHGCMDATQPWLDRSDHRRQRQVGQPRPVHRGAVGRVEPHLYQRSPAGAIEPGEYLRQAHVIVGVGQQAGGDRTSSARHRDDNDENAHRQDDGRRLPCRRAGRGGASQFTTLARRGLRGPLGAHSRGHRPVHPLPPRRVG